MLFASFFVPVRAIRSGRSQVLRLEEASVFLDAFCGEVASVFSEDGSLSGSSEEISFLSAAGTDLGLQRIVYFVREETEGDGVVVYRAAGRPWGESPGEGVPVLRAESLLLGYYDGQGWYEEWLRPEIPRLVSLELVRRGRRYRVAGRPRTGVDSDPAPDSGDDPDDG